MADLNKLNENVLGNKTTMPHNLSQGLSNSLISSDWQLSIIEKENEKTSVNLNKFDKVEVAFQFKTFDNKEEEYKNSLIKMGYNEFFEVFQNLKKIDGQLHLFKN